MERTEKAALCQISSVAGVGSRALQRGMEVCGSFMAFYQADENVLRTILTSESAAQLIALRRSKDLNWSLDRLISQGHDVITIMDEGFPVWLANIPNPPFTVYYTGNVDLLNSFALGIVGARNATNYGRIIARKFGEELAGNGVVVVSGMARGVDAQAHYGALESGTTIAVLGSGLNVIYPRENAALYDSIRQQGLVISEFPMDTPPEPGHFPMRNRIISGLSQGVAVIEAREKSGALITADFALEQGRDVFAVPGPITSKNSFGTNRLIQQGAKLVMNAADILEEYPNCHFKSRQETVVEGLLFDGEDGDEAEVLQWIDTSGIHFDQLLEQSNLEHGTLSSILLKLELKGIVTSTPGNYYVKIR